MTTLIRPHHPSTERRQRRAALSSRRAGLAAATASSLAASWGAKPTAGVDIVLPSRFDVHMVADFMAEVEHRTTEDVAALRVDAIAVKHIDHAGLDALALAEHRVKQRCGNFELRASTTVRIARELTGSPAIQPEAAVAA